MLRGKGATDRLSKESKSLPAWLARTRLRGPVCPLLPCSRAPGPTSFGKARGRGLCRCLFISRLCSPKQPASSRELRLSSPRGVTFSDSELERKPSGLRKETRWAAKGDPVGCGPGGGAGFPRAVTCASAAVMEEPIPVSPQGGPVSPEGKAHPARALLLGWGGGHTASPAPAQPFASSSQLHPCPTRGEIPLPPERMDELGSSLEGERDRPSW